MEPINFYKYYRCFLLLNVFGFGKYCLLPEATEERTLLLQFDEDCLSCWLMDMFITGDGNKMALFLHRASIYYLKCTRIVFITTKVFVIIIYI